MPCSLCQNNGLAVPQITVTIAAGIMERKEEEKHLKIKSGGARKSLCLTLRGPGHAMWIEFAQREHRRLVKIVLLIVYLLNQD